MTTHKIGSKYRTNQPLPNTKLRTVYDELNSQGTVNLQEYSINQRNNMIRKLKERYDLKIKNVAPCIWRLE